MGVGYCSFEDKNIVRSVNNVNADSVGNVIISTVTNATNATKASQNASGYALANTIVKSIAISGRTITVTKIDGTSYTLTTQDTNTTYTKLSQFTNDVGFITSTGSCAHATTADRATNANNLGGYLASKYVRSVNGVGADKNGNVAISDINEIGNGYIRFTSGLQICFREVQMDNLNISFPKPFSKLPAIVFSGTDNTYSWGSKNRSTTGFTLLCSDSHWENCCFYIAIGYWK